jgi:hypothetical protein
VAGLPHIGVLLNVDISRRDMTRLDEVCGNPRRHSVLRVHEEKRSRGTSSLHSPACPGSFAYVRGLLRQ